MTWEDMAAEAAAQKHIVITGSSANIRANADSKSSKLTTATRAIPSPCWVKKAPGTRSRSMVRLAMLPRASPPSKIDSHAKTA